ncbi:unnamed protein product [Camellia sinensis]
MKYWLCEHTTLLQPHKLNTIPRCVKWDLTALQKKMKTTSLADIGFNEVNAGELFATPIELQKFRRTTLKDIDISFSSPHDKRAIVIANTSQPDIIDMLVKENRKAWGIIRVIADLEHKLFNQSSPPNMNTEIKKFMEQKDEEIKHLTQLVIDLECEKTILQDLYDDQSVHIVTQAEAQKQLPGPMQHNLNPPSKVKHIKEEDRKEHRLPDFQYPDLLGQKQPHTVEMAEDMDKHPLVKHPKKLTLTNKFKVRSKMSKQDKQKVQALQKSRGNELLVWKGDSKSTHMYFDDIVNLINEESIHINLIDAYAELLHEQQEVVNPTSDEAPFIFTSMCLKVIREYHSRKRSKHIDAHVKNYQGERYLLFPLHHDFHWTIVVYDAKDNLWRHYNSLRPRTGIHDPHIDQAQEVRKYIENVVRVIGESSPLCTKLAG